MFSLAFRLIKLCAYLFVILLMLLLALNFKLVYQGNGRFSIQSKDKWTFTGTFVSETGGKNSRTISAGPSTRSVPPAALTPAPRPTPGIKAGAGLEECAKLRATILSAVLEYNRLHPARPMTRLDIFALLSAGLLDGIPNCPTGGEYHLKKNSRGRLKVVCSRHIE